MTFRVSKYILQPAWRVWLLHYAAKVLGVLAHVEGMPIGSTRLPQSRYHRLPVSNGSTEFASVTKP